MTQEEKQLLLKDLCARLPYGVKGIRTYRPKETITLGEIIPRCEMNPNVGNGSFCELGFDKISDCCTITEFKPYLFPLSSMTEEQRKYIADRWGINKEFDFEINPDWGEYFVELCDIVDFIDWLNENHFDYRGLIEKGLAIDATGLNIY